MASRKDVNYECTLVSRQLGSWLLTTARRLRSPKLFIWGPPSVRLWRASVLTFRVCQKSRRLVVLSKKEMLKDPNRNLSSRTQSRTLVLDRGTIINRLLLHQSSLNPLQAGLFLRGTRVVLLPRTRLLCTKKGCAYRMVSRFLRIWLYPPPEAIGVYIGSWIKVQLLFPGGMGECCVLNQGRQWLVQENISEKYYDVI